MSIINADFRYSKDHEWAFLEGDIVTIGISDHAQIELGDIVFVELPDVEDHIEANDSFGTVEAVKTVAELYAPVAGEVVAVNDELSDNAEIINSSPYEQGWIIKIKIADSKEFDALMDAAAYEQFIN